MARSINDIKQTITSIYVQEMAAIGITINPAIWSSVNLQRLLIYVVAVASFVIESLFDALRIEIEQTIKEEKPHTERWYASIALKYQHGFNLVAEQDYYDNTGISESDINAAKIVKYAAVVTQTNQFGRVYLRIKLATEADDDLGPLSQVQLDGVKEYFKRIKDAGVPLQIDSLPADSLRMQWEIRYDPLILDAQGARLDGTDSSPVQNAIHAYLKALPFNGMFALAFITDAVQAVEGVVIPTIIGAQTKYGSRSYESVNITYLPDAGYLRIYDTSPNADLQLTFIPQSVIQ